MLRALGVLFILCFCFFLGVMGMGLGYLAIRSEFWKSPLFAQAGKVQPADVDADDPRHRGRSAEELRNPPPDLVARDPQLQLAFSETPDGAAKPPVKLASYAPVGPVSTLMMTADPNPAANGFRVQWVSEGTDQEPELLLGSSQGTVPVSTPVLLKGQTVKVRVKKVGTGDPVMVGGSPELFTVDDAPTKDMWELRNYGSASTTSPFTLKDGNLVGPPLTFVRPSPSLAAPEIQEVSDNPFVSREFPKDADRLSVFGGYLRVRFLSDAPLASQHHLYGVFRVGSNVEGIRLPAEISVIGPSQGRYLYEATCTARPLLANWQKADIFLATVMDGQGHQFATRSIPLQNTSSSLPDIAAFRKAIVEAKFSPPALEPPVSVGERAYFNTTSIQIDLSALTGTTNGIVVVEDGSRRVAQGVPLKDFAITLDQAGPRTLFFKLYLGSASLGPVSRSVAVVTQGPTVERIETHGISEPGDDAYFLVFFRDPEILRKDDGQNAAFAILGPAGGELANAVTEAKWDATLQAMRVKVDKDKLKPGMMTLVVRGIGDINSLGIIKNKLNLALNQTTKADPSNEKFAFSYMPDFDLPLTTRGVRSTAAPQVLYPEYTQPRVLVQGFNPSDKVVTRIARLYYFRDAHRVSQIINRKSQSYNRAAVSVVEQLADKSRTIAESQTDTRRSLELKAVRAAQEARQAEETLRQQQDALMQARAQANSAQQFAERLQQDMSDTSAALAELDDQIRAQPTGTPTEEQTKKRASLAAKQRSQVSTQGTAGLRVTQANDEVNRIEANIRALLAQVEAKRNTEIVSTEKWEDSERKEDRAIQEQFRREVAAAKEDPDTFAKGDPNSDDPVAQVSLAVVGEGVIQLRGPRKGVNLVHSMIHDLDAPVGQTAIKVHTIQINGERGDRMEKVATRIQRYVDHSRMLTTQSAQYLRNAVVIVASRRAEECRAEFTDCSISEQEQKYREAFFGKDFLDELRELDSEFLRSGNKVLSLHSMDTTSLANALFLLALAKNDTREEILQTFFDLTQRQLPVDEMEFFEASAAEAVICSGCKRKPFQFMAQNAKFVNLRGFFQNEGIASDTLTPPQREFIRLAQIFKARLVTEIELRQRVMERSLIEQRLERGQVESTVQVDEQRYIAERRKAEEAFLRTVVAARAQMDDLRNSNIQILSNSTNLQKEVAIALDRLPESLVDGLLEQIIPEGQRQFVEQIKNKGLTNNLPETTGGDANRGGEQKNGSTPQSTVGATPPRINMQRVDLSPLVDGRGTARLNTETINFIRSNDYLFNNENLHKVTDKLDELRSRIAIDPTLQALFFQRVFPPGRDGGNLIDNKELDLNLGERLKVLYTIFASKSRADQNVGDLLSDETWLKFTMSIDVDARGPGKIGINEQLLERPLVEHRADLSDPTIVTKKINYWKALPLNVLNGSFQLRVGGKIFTVSGPEPGSSDWNVDPSFDALSTRVDELGRKLETLVQVLRQMEASTADRRMQAQADAYLQNLAIERQTLRDVVRVLLAHQLLQKQLQQNDQRLGVVQKEIAGFMEELTKLRTVDASLDEVNRASRAVKDSLSGLGLLTDGAGIRAAPYNGRSGAQIAKEAMESIDRTMSGLSAAAQTMRIAAQLRDLNRRPLDHKKFLDMLIDDVEEKHLELLEGTRAHIANVDNYVKRLSTALDDDFNTQFYFPAFRYAREASQFYDVQVGQVETTGILANNRAFAKVMPQATMEFDLPKRDILINEAFEGALAAYNDYGALLADPQFLALSRMYGGQPASATYGGVQPAPMTRSVLPGLPSQTDGQYLSQAGNNVPQIGANLEALIPDPAVYKFETGTGYEIRPVIQPDGQAVVFHFNYMYTTNIREPVRADEKHLGRVKRQFIDTDVQLGNYELREVSRYTVALKASRTSRGVPLLEDAPGIGILFRPLPQQESSLQQNVILAQSVIFPTLFDLMGLRWAPAVADLSPTSLQEREFVTRNREKFLQYEVFDYSSLQTDEFMRVPDAERRGDYYRVQEPLPVQHPNGYMGRGLNLYEGVLQEGHALPPPIVPYQPDPAPLPGEPISSTSPPNVRPQGRPMPVPGDAAALRGRASGEVRPPRLPVAAPRGHGDTQAFTQLPPHIDPANVSSQLKPEPARESRDVTGDPTRPGRSSLEELPVPPQSAPGPLLLGPRSAERPLERPPAASSPERDLKVQPISHTEERKGWLPKNPFRRSSNRQEMQP